MDNVAKKIINLKNSIGHLLNEDQKLEIDNIIKHLSDSSSKTDDYDENVDFISGVGSSPYHSRLFYGNNLGDRGSVPTFSEGYSGHYEDDNYFRGIPFFSENYGNT
jgi:hypothetical protein